jgi:hypothetical protein
MIFPGLNLVVWTVVNRLLNHLPIVIHEKMIGLISYQSSDDNAGTVICNAPLPTNMITRFCRSASLPPAGYRGLLPFLTHYAITMRQDGTKSLDEVLLFLCLHWRSREEGPHAIRSAPVF